MAVEDIYRVGIEQTLHGQLVLNVLHFRERSTDAAITDLAGALAGRVAAVVVPPMKAAQSNELNHTRIWAQRIKPTPPLIPSVVVGHAGAGSFPSNSLPTSVSVVVTKRSTFAGVKYRGRLYGAGIPQAGEDNSQIIQAHVDLWQNVGDAIATALVNGAAIWDPIIWHRSTQNYEVILACEARAVLRNQRRRQLFRGV